MKVTKSHSPFQTFANALKTFAKAYFRTPFGCALYAESYARDRGSSCQGQKVTCLKPQTAE